VVGKCTIVITYGRTKKQAMRRTLSLFRKLFRMLVVILVNRSLEVPNSSRSLSTKSRVETD
jgi:Mrp family chromosome partitioning ATPase